MNENNLKFIDIVRKGLYNSEEQDYVSEIKDNKLIFIAWCELPKTLKDYLKKITTNLDLKDLNSSSLGNNFNTIININDLDNQLSYAKSCLSPLPNCNNLYFYYYARAFYKQTATNNCILYDIKIKQRRALNIIVKKGEEDNAFEEIMNLIDLCK